MRAWLAPVCCLAVTACVTTYEPIDIVDQPETLPLAVPITIPILSLGSGESPLLLDFYTGILRRLRDAAADGDVALLDSLLASYDKPDLPASIRAHLKGYAAIARGIDFQNHLTSHAKLALRAPAKTTGQRAPAEPRTPLLGSPLQLELRVPPADLPVRLGGREDADPTCFSVAVTVKDEFVDGGSQSSHKEGFIWLPRAFDLDGDAMLTLPFEFDFAAGDTVRRTVFVHVELMQGYVQYGDRRVPVRRVVVGDGSWTQWPKGYEILAKTPLAALRLALAKFTPNNFASAYLAATLVPVEQRREATALLIDQVRFGRADQAQVAMAGLQHVSGIDLPIGDRDAWLAWWQTQR